MRRPPITHSTQCSPGRSVAAQSIVRPVSIRQQRMELLFRCLSASDALRKKRAPEFAPGVWSFWLMPRLEAVVQAGAHGVGLEARVRTKRRAVAAEIDVEVFDLGGPRTGKRRFEAATEGVAGLGVARLASAGDRVLHAANGKTAGDIGHEAIEGITDTAARGAEPVVAGFAVQADAAGRAATNVRPVEVAFETEHGLVDLIVVTDGAADQA